MKVNNQTYTNTKINVICNEGYIKGIGKGVVELCEWCGKNHKLQDFYGKTTNGSFAA
jgi:hypothetical protein